MLQNNIPVNETFWSLVSKADKKFSKIGNFPFNERTGYDVYFCKVFKVYTQLWKFQQENRQKLVEAGLKRWEIGEIASRIGQLYFGQYMRTSQASYLTESYIFYEAILSREYFKEGLFQDLNLANKQLRFLARFMMVCLVLNRREMVHQLVNQLKMLVDDCKKTFQESDFREWKTVVQEILKFQKADTAFMNLRPLRYSIVLDPHPAQLSVAGRRSLKLRDAILSSYYPNEVKFSELTLDTFRMLQCLEWEPSGSLYQSTVASLVGNSQNGAPGPSHINYSQDFTDPTLPPNPRKAMLYRPSVTHFIAVLATICEELPSDGILLVYLSALGSCVQTSSSSFNVRTELDTAETVLRDLQSHTINSDANKISPAQNKGDSLTYQADCLYIGARGHGGINCIYPCDLLPFTRRPLFLVIDSDSSKAFKAISGVEKGERTAMLLSPTCSPPIATVADSSHRRSGSLFTMFLTAPLPAFCLLIGRPGSDSEMEMYNMADKQLSSSLNDWGVTLETSENLDAVWAQVLSDPFLRRLLLRFIFCRAVLTQYAPTFQKLEFIPDCTPSLPDSVLPTTPMCQTLVLQIASIFGAAANNFVFSEGIVVPESTHADEESISS